MDLFNFAILFGKDLITICVCCCIFLSYKKILDPPLNISEFLTAWWGSRCPTVFQTARCNPKSYDTSPLFGKLLPQNCMTNERNWTKGECALDPPSICQCSWFVVLMNKFAVKISLTDFSEYTFLRSKIVAQKFF